MRSLPLVAVLATLALAPLSAATAAPAPSPDVVPSGTHRVVRDPAHDVRLNLKRHVAKPKNLTRSSIDLHRVVFRTTASRLVVTAHLDDLSKPTGPRQAYQKVQTTLEWTARGKHHLLFLVYDTQAVGSGTGLYVPSKGCNRFAAHPDPAGETVAMSIPITCFRHAGPVTASTASNVILAPRNNAGFGQNQLLWIDDTREVDLHVTAPPTS